MAETERAGRREFVESEAVDTGVRWEFEKTEAVSKKREGVFGRFPLVFNILCYKLLCN